MRKLSAALLLTLPLFAVIIGCNPSPAPSSNSPPTSTSTAVPPRAVDLTEVRFEQLEAAVKAQKGHVVLMDFWATWCGPCVARFPHLVETNKKYRDKGLVCMSVSLDPKGEKDKYDKAKVLKFLKDKDAVFPNFVLLGYNDEKDQAKVDKYFGIEGGIPFMVMFDKAGRRVWTSEQWMEKGYPPELFNSELDKLIEEQLAK